MPRRKPSRPGLSYYDANSHRLISEGPDILDIKKEIELRWPGVIEVWFDTYEEHWVVIEKCRDGVDRHVTNTTRLDQRLLDKLQKIDEAKHPQEDLALVVDRFDREEEREKDHNLLEATGDGIERLEHALRKDGILNNPKMFVGKTLNAR